MIIGNHLENNDAGQIIKLRTSRELYRFYLRQGNRQMAEEWKEYHRVAKKRRKLFGEFLRNSFRYSEKEQKNFVDNPDMVKGVRMEIYFVLSVKMCLSNPRRFFLGPNAEDKQWLLGNRFEEPEFKLDQLTVAEDVNGGVIKRAMLGITLAHYYFTGGSN